MPHLSSIAIFFPRLRFAPLLGLTLLALLLLPSSGRAAEGAASYSSEPSSLAVSDTMIVSGPSVNNLKATPPKGEAARHFRGYAARNQLFVGHRFGALYDLGGVLDLTQPYYGSQSGKLILNDPQIRFGVNNLTPWSGENWSLMTPSFFSYYAPASELSRKYGQVSALSATFIPIFKWDGFPLYATGLFSFKTGFYSNAPKGLETNLQYFTGAQANAELFSWAHPYAMIFLAGARGAEYSVLDEGISAQAGRPGNGSIWGTMLGIRFKPTRKITISPRYAKVLGDPWSRGSVALNAKFSIF